MRSRREIENQLEHFRSGACGTAGTPENAVWIKALEWVLLVSEPEQKAEYDRFIALMAELFADPPVIREKLLPAGFEFMLNRLK